MVLKPYDDCGGQLNPKKCFFAQLRNMVSENGIEVDTDKVKAIMLLPSPESTKQLATFTEDEVHGKVYFIALTTFISIIASGKEWPFAMGDEKCKEVFQSVKEVLGAMPAMQAPDWE